MEAKLKTPTCSRCKIRKIRCDGSEPCSSCSAAAASCQYDAHAKESRFGLELRKGQACLACRRKKKRCDGQLPCRTCASGRTKICEYPDGIIVTLPLQKSDGQAVRIDTLSNESPSPDAPRVSRKSSNIAFTAFSNNSSETSGSSTSGSPHLPIRSTPSSSAEDMAVDIGSPSPFAHPEITSQPANYTSLAELSQARDSFLDNTGKHNLVAPEIPMDNGLAADSDRPSSNPIPEFFKLKILKEVPKTDSEELSGLRTLFIYHRAQLGLSVPNTTLTAIQKGTPDATLHPGLLHACQLLGYMLARQLNQTNYFCRPGESEREAEQLKLTFDAIDCTELVVCPPPLAFVQTANLVSLYFFTKGDIARARELIVMGNTFVRTQDLDSMADSPSAESTRSEFQVMPTTEIAERQAAVAQLVFLDLLYAIILKIPSIIDPLLRERFKKLVDHPNVHAEINYVRAKSAFLMYETQRLTVQWLRQPGLDESEIVVWQQTYWDVMEALDAHRSFITVTLTSSRVNGHRCPPLTLLGRPP
ncbi:hypothetical protein B0H14DRAFT_1093341 [Mycena olivaceomarginata]|nr:hypothetical protein B0H14DRAFT_1093341 [Mycena olivaceomarginata]